MCYPTKPLCYVCRTEQGLLESLAAVVRRSDERIALLEQHLEQRLARQEKLLEDLLRKSALNFEVATLQQQVASGATMGSPQSSGERMIQTSLRTAVTPCIVF